MLKTYKQVHKQCSILGPTVHSNALIVFLTTVPLSTGFVRTRKGNVGISMGVMLPCILLIYVTRTNRNSKSN